MEQASNTHKDYLLGLLYTAEIKLTACMLNDVGNYDIVMNKFNDLSFYETTCNDLLIFMNNFYTKSKYTKIDLGTVSNYCTVKGIKEEQATKIKSAVSTINKNFGDLKGLENFDGVLETYSMVSSTYKFHDWVVGCGGIDSVSEKLLRLNNQEEVNQVIEGRLLDFFNVGTVDASIKDTNLTEFIDDKFIEDIMNKEDLIETTPLLNQFYILNRLTKGFVRGLTGFGARSGVGKSSFMYSVYVMSMLENSDSKICIYANEQTSKVFAIGMFFAFIAQVINTRHKKGEEFEKLGMIKLSRDRFITGNFNEEETKLFVAVIKLFKRRYANRVTHAYFEDMTPMALAKDVRKKVRSGHKYFFYDTFKDPNEDYKNLMALATKFDQLTKKYPIHGYMSLQLVDESEGVRYLTNKYLASAKGIKRVVENLLLMRNLEVEELPLLKVHKLGKPNEVIPLDLKNKNYYAVFIDKNRNGTNEVVLLYEIYLDILKYKEIGVIENIPKDMVVVRPNFKK